MVFLLAVAVADRSALMLLPIAAALIHEAGHLIAMLILHCDIKELEITMFGAEIRAASNTSGLVASVIIFASGGAVNFLCAAAVAPYAQSSYPLQLFCACSLALAAVNLLPIKTLDGGCILEAVTAHFVPTHADAVINAVSAITLLFLWLAGVYLLLLCQGNLSVMLLCMYLFTSLYLK